MFFISLKFCYENMHVHVSLSSTFDIKISGWTKAIKSTEMNLETFQFYFTSILSENKGKEQ